MYVECRSRLAGKPRAPRPANSLDREEGESADYVAEDAAIGRPIRLLSIACNALERELNALPADLQLSASEFETGDFVDESDDEDEDPSGKD